MSFSRLWRAGGSSLRRLHTARPRALLPLQAQTRTLLPVAIGTLIAVEAYRIWSHEAKDKDNSLESLPVAPGRPQPSLFEKNPVHALTLDQAEKKLKSGQESGYFDNVKFHTYRLGSNYPVEDHYVYDSRPSLGGANWHYWGVFDGHA